MGSRLVQGKEDGEGVLCLSCSVLPHSLCIASFFIPLLSSLHSLLEDLKQFTDTVREIELRRTIQIKEMLIRYLFLDSSCPFLPSSLHH